MNQDTELGTDQFNDFFRVLYGYDPFPWQSRLARNLAQGDWPDCIDLPTASGKTSVVDIAVFTLACQAQMSAAQRKIGRRIFFAVNRRVIVDEAFDRAKTLAEKLQQAEDDNDANIVGRVARALRTLNEEQDPSRAPPLDIAQLRGGVFRDRAWARSLTQPLIACTTADQLGSRLLFRGYGVSPYMQPVHAALCACDSVILLDEAHVTKAFCQTMSLLTRYQCQHTNAAPRHVESAKLGLTTTRYQCPQTNAALTAPPMRFVQMTATPSSEPKRRFELGDDDRKHPVLSARQAAAKPTTLIELDKKKSIADEIVTRAVAAISDQFKTVGIIVNRVQTARDIEAGIRVELAKNKIDAEVHLVIGRMRPIDRDDLQAKLRNTVGPGRPDDLPKDQKPVFVVATQCLEVGADYDFDALITECASIDVLRQRFGRLNRKGRPIDTVASIVTNDDTVKGADPIYGDAIKHTWAWLASNGRTQVDFGIAAFNELWDQIDTDTRLKMTAPAPDAAVLLPAHLDALCQTSPQPVPSPDVSYFIHGPQRDMADVNVCWRADLGDEPGQWAEVVRLLPPTSPECMPVPVSAVRKWMIGEPDKTATDADLPVTQVDDESKQPAKQVNRVLVWRGSKEAFDSTDPKTLRPGDTVVIPTSSLTSFNLGHLPDAPTDADFQKNPNETYEQNADRVKHQLAKLDVAERATRQSRLRVVFRLTDALPGRAAIRQTPANQLHDKLGELLALDTTLGQAEKGRMEIVVKGRFDRHVYQQPSVDSPDQTPDEVIVFRTLIDPPTRLELPVDEDAGDDNLSQQTAYRTLDDHTKDVVDRLRAALPKLNLDDLKQTFERAADLHDIGKADLRFQAMLAGITPYEAMERPVLLGKGDGIRRTRAEQNAILQRALFPDGFRHEMLGVEILENTPQLLEPDFAHRNLLLHLIAAHHGYARPFAPVCLDNETDNDTDTDTDLRSIFVRGTPNDGIARKTWTPAHRLDSGVAERFWDLTRAHGWWGLAWLESILRLADQQASASPPTSNTKAEPL